MADTTIRPRGGFRDVRDAAQVAHEARENAAATDDPTIRARNRAAAVLMDRLAAAYEQETSR